MLYVILAGAQTCTRWVSVGSDLFLQALLVSGTALFQNCVCELRPMNGLVTSCSFTCCLPVHSLWQHLFYTKLYYITYYYIMLHSIMRPRSRSLYPSWGPGAGKSPEIFLCLLLPAMQDSLALLHAQEEPPAHGEAEDCSQVRVICALYYLIFMGIYIYYV